MRAFRLVPIALSLLCAAAGRPVPAASPVTIPFQGMLRDAAGRPITSPAAGTSVVFSLYPASTGAAAWTETQPVHAVNGLFTASLGSVTPFASLAFDKPYWVGVKAGADPEMTPRLPLQSVPYALNAWSIGGNAGTDPAKHFLGTTDGAPLLLKAGGRRVAQYQDALAPGGYRSVNVLAGSEVNTIAADAVGSTIGGGGRLNGDGTSAPNDMRGNFSVIGGGAGNFVDANWFMVVGGGSGNITQSIYSTIGGGNGNNTQGDWSTIAGGNGNYASGSQSTVAGGGTNQATGTMTAVGGGGGNMAGGEYAAIAGGDGNNAFGSHSFAGGGTRNKVGDGAAVASGYENQANGLRSFIGAGYGNATATGYDSVIGGGQNNSATGGDAAILGGYGNKASANSASVGGGSFNEATGEHAAIGGGSGNKSYGGATTVAGGASNLATDLWAVISGGSNNYATAKGAVVSGGYTNDAAGVYSTIPGGANNYAYNAAFAAGYRAVAQNTGSFVWSDYSSDQDFVSQADNQFCIRAKGGIVIESFASPAIYTGQSTAELNRYLVLLNSYLKPSASGLKAGGILCADSFDYANPGKSNMVVKGTLGVGYPDPAPYTMAVNGNIYSAGGYQSSDARLKKDVMTLEDALGTVDRLRGVSFEWNQQAAGGRNLAEGRQIGFIAQEVERVLPEVVSTDGQGYKAVSYTSVVPVLVEAVKTLKQQNEDLSAENRALSARLDALTAAVASLQDAR